MITLADLAAAATGTASRSSKTPFFALTVEEARGFCKIKDGNKRQADDGSQRLTVVLGKHTLPMDAIKVGTTRIAVTAEQIEPYTKALQDAIDQGLFDAGIAKAQELSRAQAEKAAGKSRTPKPTPAPEGLDLAELDNLA